MVIFSYNISLISRYTERYNCISFLIIHNTIFLSCYLYSIIYIRDSLLSRSLKNS
ncbi:putative transcriptional regulator [Saccharolobus solfataricus]|uniref:Putative transcriptional regulator n=1 Tax=Saccharolobus solfataricus TaxID=2287 RepID=A0A157SZH4_SACSO|nr:putative transcriptional regulator [Saccharolobus solfataricus]